MDYGGGGGHTGMGQMARMSSTDRQWGSDMNKAQRCSMEYNDIPKDEQD